MCMHALAHMWWSEDLQEPVPSFYCVDPKEQPQPLRLVSKPLDESSHQPSLYPLDFLFL